MSKRKNTAGGAKGKADKPKGTLVDERVLRLAMAQTLVSACHDFMKPWPGGVIPAAVVIQTLMNRAQAIEPKLIGAPKAETKAGSTGFSPSDNDPPDASRP